MKERIRSESLVLVADANKQLVKTQQESDYANIILTRLTAGLKGIEMTRLSFTAPLTQSKREIDNFFKQITAPIDQAKRDLSNRVLAFRQELRRKDEEARLEHQRREEEARLKQEAERNRRQAISDSAGERGLEQHEIAPVAEPEPESAPAETLARDTTKVRYQWTYEVAEFDKIPHKYLTLDKGAIQRAIRDGIRDIEGIKIFEKEIPVYA